MQFFNERAKHFFERSATQEIGELIQNLAWYRRPRAPTYRHRGDITTVGHLLFSRQGLRECLGCFWVLLANMSNKRNGSRAIV